MQALLVLYALQFNDHIEAYTSLPHRGMRGECLVYDIVDAIGFNYGYGMSCLLAWAPSEHI
jgi:hypothetical protein